AAELANYHLLSEKSLKPELLMGHSLGDIACLGAAQSLSTEDIFKITKVRAQVTERSNESNPGGMAAFLGFTHEQTSRIITMVNTYLQRFGHTSAGYMANRNWRLEQVMSGHEDAIARAQVVVKRIKSLKVVEKAGVVKLKVPG